MSQLREDPVVWFGYARSMLAHHALQAPADSDRFLMMTALGQIATGLEIMSIHLKATYQELSDVKAMLQKMQRRAP